jgi:hypothetical protein
MMMNKMERKKMKNKNRYRSVHEIQIARARLRYKARLSEEKLKTAGNLLVSNVSIALRDIKTDIRNRLISFSIFRTLSRTNFIYNFTKNFIRGFRKTA